MDFTVPLEDVSVPEKKQAKFQCAITRDVPKVMWLRGSDIISQDQKYEIIDDGKKHMLVINNCEFDDEAQYTIEVLGKSSTAKLTVEGKFVAFKIIRSSQVIDRLIISPTWYAMVGCFFYFLTGSLHALLIHRYEA